MGCLRVLLADDAPEIVAAVTELLQRDFEVIGSAQNGAQAIDAVSTLNPDLVVLDISMPVFNGMQVALRLRQMGCTAKIIFLTIHQDQDYIEAAFSAGAEGYVFKSRIGTDLVPAIKGVLRGYKFTSSFSPSCLTTVQRGLQEPETFLVTVPEPE
jgi:DNA-binding NarL/FixJ family response regulator